MDSLQPLLTHRFWVCFGVSVLLIPVGWWMGSSSLAREIAANRGEIESAENGIPKGADHPNKDWIAGLEKVVVKRKSYYDVHAVELWDMQRSVMKWPEAVTPAMAGAKYFGPGNDENARTTYNTVYYVDTIERLYQIVDPIGVNGSGTEVGWDSETNRVTTGKVVFAYETLPKVPLDLWKSRNPEWREMWDAQLDAWLLEALLKSIKRVNERKGTKNVHDASIREIVTLALRGGSPKTEGAAAAGSGSSSDSVAGGKGPMGIGGGGAGVPTPSQGDGRGGASIGLGAKRPMGTGGDGGGGIAGGSGGPLNIDFLDDVFGPQVARESASKDGGDKSTQDQTPMATGGDQAMQMMRSRGRMSSGSGSDQNMSPYVDNDPEMPFKTRGFVIQVLMNRRDLPLLIQELTDAEKSKFPIEILRIHEVDRDIDHTGVAVRSRLGGPGGDAVGPMGDAGADDSIKRSKRMAPMPMPGVGVGGAGAGVLGGGGPKGGAVLPMGGAAADQGRANNSEPWASALNDPGMGYVVIAGLMTIYQPPKEKEKKAGADADADRTPPVPDNKAASPKQPAGGKAPVVAGKAKSPGKPASAGKTGGAASKAASKSTPAGTKSRQSASKSKPSARNPQPGDPKGKSSGPGPRVDPKTKSPTPGGKSPAGSEKT